MFNTTTATATINPSEFTSDYISAGINDNVFLKEVNVKKSPTGKDFLEIIFENEAGQTASLSEWKNEKGLYTKTDEDLQRADNAQFGRMMQIINCFYETIEDTTLNSFADMINWVSSKLTPMIATKKALRLKVVYDKKGYTTISRNGIFVEPMTVTETQIKKFARDLFERPVQADNEATADPLAGNSIQGSESQSSSPFEGTGNDDTMPF